MADVVNLSGGRYSCDASDMDGIMLRGLYANGFMTGDIIVPKGQKWVYKDYKIDYSWSGRYYPPYIVYKNKGGGKKYQLPEDGRDFILYQGDAFQLGISLPEETFEYVEVSVIFHIEYDDCTHELEDYLTDFNKLNTFNPHSTQFNFIVDMGYGIDHQSAPHEDEEAYRLGWSTPEEVYDWVFGDGSVETDNDNH
jgi:hypothetical protein